MLAGLILPYWIDNGLLDTTLQCVVKDERDDGARSKCPVREVHVQLVE